MLEDLDMARAVHRLDGELAPRELPYRVAEFGVVHGYKPSSVYRSDARTARAQLGR